MEGDHAPSSALNRPGKVEVLLVSRQAVEQDDGGVQPRSCGQIQLRVDAFAMADELEAATARRIGTIDGWILADRGRSSARRASNKCGDCDRGLGEEPPHDWPKTRWKIVSTFLRW